MRIFSKMPEAMKEVERDLFEMGTRIHPETMQDKVVSDKDEFRTIELCGYGYILSRFDVLEAEEFLQERYEVAGLNWAHEEFQERIQDRYLNPGNAWTKRFDFWRGYLRDGQFAYTYNERFREQLPFIIRELVLRPNSRQVVLQMFNYVQDRHSLGGKDRVPCSLNYQFLRRNGKLDMVYTMRSCDLVNHLPFDLYFAGCLLQHVAGRVREQSGVPLETGSITHVFGSLHAYAKDLEGKGIF